MDAGSPKPTKPYISRLQAGETAFPSLPAEVLGSAGHGFESHAYHCQSLGHMPTLGLGWSGIHRETRTHSVSWESDSQFHLRS